MRTASLSDVTSGGFGVSETGVTFGASSSSFAGARPVTAFADSPAGEVRSATAGVSLFAGPEKNVKLVVSDTTSHGV